MLISEIECLADINPFWMNGFALHFQLGESTFILRGIRNDFKFYSIFR